jgi:hypothetical protein
LVRRQAKEALIAIDPVDCFHATGRGGEPRNQSRQNLKGAKGENNLVRTDITMGMKFIQASSQSVSTPEAFKEGEN